MENASRKTDTGILVDQSPAEIIGGRVVMMSPARTDHQRVARNIARFFGNYLEGKTCEVFGDGALLYLSEENQFIPDGMIVCDPGKIREDGVHGAPDLVVEILSPSTASNDRIHKKDIYGQCGVREYWIISVRERSVEVYLPEGEQLVLKNVYTLYPAYLVRSMNEAEKTELLVEDFRCSLFPDLPIPLERIFAQVET